MVELQPSKLVVRVRFPSPAPLVRARFRRSGVAFRHVGTTRCYPSFRVVTLSSAGRVRDECGTSSGGGWGAEADEPRPSTYTNRRAPDGSPRPTCASTARRCPRTPTTVTPVTLRNVLEWALGACKTPQAERPLFAAAPGPGVYGAVIERRAIEPDDGARTSSGTGRRAFPPRSRSAICCSSRDALVPRRPRTDPSPRCVERMRRSGRFSMQQPRAGTTSSR